ncbi:MAG: hypothetical protein RBT76_09285 [candidate division Zixibacteria bacterium]|jgi:hypothetical protein|nr:hypothetical protein [candidate division Zixibacteria bacterium]
MSGTANINAPYAIGVSNGAVLSVDGKEKKNEDPLKMTKQSHFLVSHTQA